MARAADIRISCGFPSHPKTIKLGRRCGDAGIVSLLRLWTFAGQFKTTGSLAGMDAEEIAIAAGWTGDPKEFESALIDTGFADGSSGELCLHDWAEHQPYAAGFEERSKRARQAARSRWDAAGDPGSMRDASEPGCRADASSNADGNVAGNTHFENGIASSTAAGNAPSNAPSPSPLPSGTDTRSFPKTLLPASSAGAAASPDEEFRDSPWLSSFLKEQTAFNGNLLPRLIHHDFWADVGDACNGIDVGFLRVEFAQMAIWLRENPRKAPTPKGVRQFVAGWLLRAADKRGRKVA